MSIPAAVDRENNCAMLLISTEFTGDVCAFNNPITIIIRSKNIIEFITRINNYFGGIIYKYIDTFNGSGYLSQEERKRNIYTPNNTTFRFYDRIKKKQN